jgi:hypothetical protein
MPPFEESGADVVVFQPFQDEKLYKAFYSGNEMFEDLRQGLSGHHNN